MYKLLFQSTHPRGVRRYDIPLPAPVSLFQSTHPRGVRRARRMLSRRSRNFNPRTHAGCDTSVVYSRTRAPLFQSTHPRGVRHLCLSPHTPQSCISIHAPTRGATPGKRDGFPGEYHFNPRTHAGCDVKMPKREPVPADISIHAPTRGATCLPFTFLVPVTKFQSTHPRGVRRQPLLLPSQSQYFNPRTHAGCDCSVIDISS